MRAAREVIVLADSSKFGKVEFCTIAPLSAIQRIMTDSKLPKEKVRRRESNQIEVVVAWVLRIESTQQKFDKDDELGMENNFHED